VFNKDELYSGIELGTINLDNLKKIVKKNVPKNIIKYWELKLIGSKRSQKDTHEAPEKIDTSVPFLLREKRRKCGAVVRDCDLLQPDSRR